MVATITDAAMFPRLPTVTKTLLIANIALLLLQMLPQTAGVFEQLMLWPLGSQDVNPYSPGFEPWQLLTYGFLHGGLGHLFFNMMALFMFGAPLELTWGEKRFLTYYLMCVVGAGLCQLLVTAWAGEYGPVLGASGGVFGLLLAYGMLFPNQRVMLLFPPIPMKARTFVIVFGLMELVLGVTGWQPGVAHVAHLGGMLFGWLRIRYWRGQPPFNKRGGGRPNHLRSVK